MNNKKLEIFTENNFQNIWSFCTWEPELPSQSFATLESRKLFQCWVPGLALRLRDSAPW